VGSATPHRFASLPASAIPHRRAAIIVTFEQSIRRSMFAMGSSSDSNLSTSVLIENVTV
jgi:hypothetical protein